MPAYRVTLTRIPRVQGCCGHPRTVSTETLGTVVSQGHYPRCLVGRVLRRPSYQDVREPGGRLDDRDQLRRALA